MKIFKFGGSALADVASVQRVGEIIDSFSGEKILVILSAAGKTTAELEKVAEVFYSGQKEQAIELFADIKTFHLTLASHLLVKTYNEAVVELSYFFTEVEWMLHDKPVRAFEYYYDQIVCTGELFSSYIISAYLNETGHANQWLDVRDIIRTNNSFTAAEIDRDFTSRMVNTIVPNTLAEFDILVTQGFIGSTDENESTTLGPAGKDYSAAVLANILDADSVTLWKDVDGLMDADPRRFEDAAPFAELTYLDAALMGSYGAKVIDPETIELLDNKDIPLVIRSFIDPLKPGTLVSGKTIVDLLPIRVLIEGQVLLYLQSPGSAVIPEELEKRLFQLMRDYHFTPKLLKMDKLKISCCLDGKPAQLEQFALAVSEYFEVQIEKGVTLLTIIHSSKPLFEQMIRGKQVILTHHLALAKQAVWRE